MIKREKARKFISLRKFINLFSEKNKLSPARVVPYKLNLQNRDDSGFIVDYGERGLLNFLDAPVINSGGFFDDEVCMKFIPTNPKIREYDHSYIASGCLDNRTITLKAHVTRIQEEKDNKWGEAKERTSRSGNKNYWFYVY